MQVSTSIACTHTVLMLHTFNGTNVKTANQHKLQIEQKTFLLLLMHISEKFLGSKQSKSLKFFLETHIHQ